MTLLADPLSSTAFATPHAGEDYFATEAHYLSLAGRLVAALRRGAVFVFLTGDPPPDALLLTRALFRHSNRAPVRPAQRIVPRPGTGG